MNSLKKNENFIDIPFKECRDFDSSIPFELFVSHTARNKVSCLHAVIFK